MNRAAVKSTNLREVGHDSDTNTLEVQFHGKACSARQSFLCNCKGGDVFTYSNVKPEEHSMLINAPSVGAHFMKYIRAFPERHMAAKSSYR